MNVVIVDDHEVVRRGIRTLLANHDVQVCGEASTGKDALALVATHLPDVVVMDIGLPDISGIGLTRTIREKYPSIEVVILTSHEGGAMISEALAAGARAVVYKSDAMTDLLLAIDSVRRKHTFLSPHVTEMIVQTGMRNPNLARSLRGLTEREREILRLLAEGKSYKEVAFDLKISPKTVNVHRANIMQKLDIRSLAELIHYAIRNEIVRL